jgi:uncharacterized protein YodC (DUF2158 family)
MQILTGEYMKIIISNVPDMTISNAEKGIHEAHWFEAKDMKVVKSFRTHEELKKAYPDCVR